ncbi:caspase-7-like [Pomacea canaliculata]|uniref:caspase-7-like n=1 Tax=Pomacea canaliculata TaxID=400727 RepID=UPI000D72A31D|nr:caspase-7-like [Pomacea canaliculata]
MISCNVTMAADLEDVSNSNTGYLKETEDLEDDEPEGVKDFLKKKYKQVKKAFRRSGKKERPLNMATTDDKEDGSRTEVSPIVEDPDEYNFSHSRRGLALIIDNENFTSASRLPSRQGSDKDLTSLGDMFNRLGFEVEGYKDLKGEDMWKVLTEAAGWKWHKDSDCLAVAILSHGGEMKWPQLWNHRKEILRQDFIFGVDGQYLLTSSIMDCFNDDNCPALKGKPRLFFLQACRGENVDPGQDIAVVSDKPEGLHMGLNTPHGTYGANGSVSGDTIEQSEADTRPTQGQITHDTGSGDAESQGQRNDANEEERDETNKDRPAVSLVDIYNDFLVMYATLPGYYAWRRPTGSWFVQSLCTVFGTYRPRMSLIQALTRVTGMVTTLYESVNKKNPHESGMKQTPVIQTRLLKDVYFT